MSYLLKHFSCPQEHILNHPTVGEKGKLPMTMSLLQLHFIFVTDPLTKMMF